MPTIIHFSLKPPESCVNPYIVHSLLEAFLNVVPTECEARSQETWYANANPDMPKPFLPLTPI